MGRHLRLLDAVLFPPYCHRSAEDRCGVGGLCGLYARLEAVWVASSQRILESVPCQPSNRRMLNLNAENSASLAVVRAVDDGRRPGPGAALSSSSRIRDQGNQVNLADRHPVGPR